MTNLALNSAETRCNNFENLKANFLSADTFTGEANKPAINFYNEKLQELDSEILLSRRNK